MFKALKHIFKALELLYTALGQVFKALGWKILLRERKNPSRGKRKFHTVKV